MGGREEEREGEREEEKEGEREGGSEREERDESVREVDEGKDALILTHGLCGMEERRKGDSTVNRIKSRKKWEKCKCQIKALREDILVCKYVYTSKPDLRLSDR